MIPLTCDVVGTACPSNGLLPSLGANFSILNEFLQFNQFNIIYDSNK